MGEIKEIEIRLPGKDAGMPVNYPYEAVFRLGALCLRSRGCAFALRASGRLIALAWEPCPVKLLIGPRVALHLAS